MNLSAIQQADAQDPLACKRDEFALKTGQIYLDGNSLGALPKAARQRAMDVVEQQWGDDLITSWNRHQWIDLPVSVGEKIAPLIGAEAGQVICCDSISVNLFKLLACALNMQPGRHRVISQKDNFPTDLYMVEGISRFVGEKNCELHLVEAQHIEAALDDSVAVLMLTHVNFRSGQIHDMQRLTRLAHQKGILVIWDLAHSAGALPVHLDACNVDFAVGCGYKYLNGGPGAPAFVYAAKRHHANLTQPLQGWMGHAKPFAFDHRYQPAQGMQCFLVGTPAVLSMAVLDEALNVFDGVDMSLVRRKSVQQSELFIQLLEASFELGEFTLASPEDASQRGSQVSVSNHHAYAICQALIAQGVIADFRAPDILRFGFTPLYTSYEDVWNAAAHLRRIMTEKTYLQPAFQVKAKVT